MKPLISVIIPVYNTEKYLAEAIDSILAQTYSPLEIIVVDDGSIDKTAKVAQQYGSSVRYHYQQNQGISAARNAGIALAKGEFFAFLDADDLWVPQKLDLQMRFFIVNNELEAVFGHTQQFYSPELEESLRQKIYCPPESMGGYLVSTLLIQRSTFFRVGRFDTRWQTGTDVSWYLQARDIGFNFQMLPDVVHLRRLHDKNHGTINRHQFNQRLHILKESLDRRRQQSNDRENGSTVKT
jgi:glycosyltransferase involved in cell wall biosynthesis